MAEIAFPGSGIIAWTLRRERDKGHLAVFRLCGRAYLTASLMRFARRAAASAPGLRDIARVRLVFAGQERGIRAHADRRSISVLFCELGAVLEPHLRIGDRCQLKIEFQGGEPVSSAGVEFGSKRSGAKGNGVPLWLLQAQLGTNSRRSSFGG